MEVKGFLNISKNKNESIISNAFYKLKSSALVLS